MPCEPPLGFHYTGWVEILGHPALTPEQGSILDLHSMLNLLNLVGSQLYLLNRRLPGTTDLMDTYRQATAFARSLADPSRSRLLPGTIPELVASVRASLPAIDGPSAEELGGVDSEIRALVTAVSQTLTVVETRTAELVRRADQPFRWREFTAGALRDDLLAVLRVMEISSLGRYRIVTEPGNLDASSYLVTLDFGPEDAAIRLPAVFPDVMRDLVANSRKYTPPGGRISASLSVEPDHLTYRVRDNGMGIPQEEIRLVTHFGFRAGNASGERTFGGGFGLTKALWVTRETGGRMWIESPAEDGHGTEVRIRLPLVGGAP